MYVKCTTKNFDKGDSFRFKGVTTGLTISFPGLDRSAFDNKVVSFDEHINSEHNMWHYLYFIVLLKVKDTTEFTGPESYVSQMVKVRVEMFPEGVRDGKCGVEFDGDL